MGTFLTQAGQSLLKLHDALSKGAFILGSAALAVIVASFAYEVVMRYFFNAPTRWASDLVSFLLLTSVFLAAPWLTREGGHVSITLLPDLLPAKWARRVIAAGFLVAAIVCFWAGWIVSGEVRILFERGTRTLSAVSVPKWWFTALILFGFINSAFYFLRRAFDPYGDATTEDTGNA
ncbi:TRAP transporter small permease [Salipiger abyssi]|uniref:TRAP transporter small permease n=1 Tax=Salipiger abyssi TaxID=1250539 RepID=UPI001A8F3E5C|nr:TRAP transporter small permease [Salipiger abyssi]MBN9888916.1 TRAP transporter small permease [Salipiger abyssi]